MQAQNLKLRDIYTSTLAGLNAWARKQGDVLGAEEILRNANVVIDHGGLFPDLRSHVVWIYTR
jgi:hypothetical protein